MIRTLIPPLHRLRSVLDTVDIFVVAAIDIESLRGFDFVFLWFAVLDVEVRLRRFKSG